jgi:hypothetical protein
MPLDHLLVHRACAADVHLSRRSAPDGQSEIGIADPLHRPSNVCTIAFMVDQLPPSQPVGSDVADCSRDEIDADSLGPLCDEVAGHLNAQMGRLLDLTMWLVNADTRDWQGEGLWTPQQYLAWRCGIGPTAASNLVAAAKRSAELPLTLDALRAGEVSFDQVMPIIRTVPGWADAQIISLARRLTVTQIRRLVRSTDWTWMPRPAVASDDTTESGEHCESGTANRTDTSSQPADPVTADHNRVTYGNGPDGRWFMHADLDADLGALVETACDEARDAVFQRENRGDAMNGVFVPVSDVEGFVELAQRSLDTVSDASRRHRYRVNLHLDLDGTVSTERGHRLPDSIGRLLTCDGAVDPVFARSGTPISVGRSQRTIPDRTRRTVLRRDGHMCQVPGCTAGRGLDLHHIVHWSAGGPTDTANLVTLCSRHHRMHHRRRLGIEGDADKPETLEFADARGRPIRRSGANPVRPNGPPPRISGTYAHPLGERLDGRWVTFVDPAVPSDLVHHRTDVA